VALAVAIAIVWARARAQPGPPRLRHQQPRAQDHDQGPGPNAAPEAGFLLAAVLALGGSVRGRIGAPDIDQLPDASTRLISIGPVPHVYTTPWARKGCSSFYP